MMPPQRNIGAHVPGADWRPAKRPCSKRRPHVNPGALLLSAIALSLPSCTPSPAVEGAACEKAADCAEGLFCLGRACRHEHRENKVPDAGSTCKADCAHKCDGQSDGCGGTCTQPCDWMKVPLGGDNPPVPNDSAMVYDSVRNRAVLFLERDQGWDNVNETWERTSAGWTKYDPKHRPPDGLTGYAMTFDQARGTTVLFGGSYRNEDGRDVEAGDTWTWDGEDWRRQSPRYSPSARAYHVMSYDEGRQRVVLHGGCHDLGSMLMREFGCTADTWEWDGYEWQLALPTETPQVRVSQSMTYDPARGKVVMYGGMNEPCVPYLSNCYHLKDLWEWNGSDWTELVPENPPKLSSAFATFDANVRRVILYPCAVDLFGNSAGGACTLDGRTFKNLGSPGTAVAGFGYGLSFDNSRKRVVLFGGSRRRLNDTLEWDGTSWQFAETQPAPSARGGANAVFDTARGVTVLFGGRDDQRLDFPNSFDDTWEWDGHEWRLPRPVGHPTNGRWRAMVFDDVRDRTVLFDDGACGDGGPCGETWTWNGNTWTRVATVHTPGHRADSAMAFDSKRDRVVLFGGRSSGAPADLDTWEFDGEDWIMRRTSEQPAARTGHAMAFDNKRGKVVLYGGEGAGKFRDTWEWDGDVWRKMADGDGPDEAFFFQMAYDSSRSRVVLHGEVTHRVGAFFIETWAWDGRTWRLLETSNRPSASIGFAMTYDSWRDKVVLFGGSPDGNWYLDETWEFGAP